MKPTIYYLLSALLVLSACGPNGPPETLTRLTPVNDPTCPQGGVLLQTGQDTNRNGVLDDAEVLASDEVCNGHAGAAGAPGADGVNGANGVNGVNGLDGVDGGRGFNALNASTALPVGDVHCAGGGVRLEVGLDDGRNGGVAGDGVLQAGEVRDTTYVCDGALPTYPGTTVAPAGPAGAAVIDSSGGDSDGGTGGRAGAISLANQGSAGGAAAVFATGSADAGFTVPAWTFDGGALPVTIAVDTIVHGYPTLDAGLGSGDPLFSVRGAVFAVDAGAPSQVTGLRLATGATLTWDDDRLELSHDLALAGTLTTPRTQGTPRTLSVHVERYLGAPGAALALQGAPGTTTLPGGNGGSLVLHAETDFINEATISLQGGDGLADGPGAAGGNGGILTLQTSAGRLISTGRIDVSGGQGQNTARGGSGGRIWLDAPLVHLRGAIGSRGGAAQAAPGGGGGVSLNAHGREFLFAAALDSSGGPCLPPTAVGVASCRAGRGGSVNLQQEGGPLLFSGDITTEGGSVPLARPGWLGGNGGPVSIASSPWYSASLTVPAGTVVASGSVRARGGFGFVGGRGGNVSVTLQPQDLPRGQELLLLGYSTLRACGGNGGTGVGGRAWTVTLTNADASTALREAQAPGPTILSVSVSARGGEGLAMGGWPGRVFVSDSPQGGGVTAFHQPSQQVTIGPVVIDVQGGNGYPGGTVTAWSNFGVENHAEILASGGAGTTSLSGGAGGSISLRGGYGATLNTGALRASGADALGFQPAGSGGSISLSSQTVSTSGTLEARGGSAPVQAGAGGSITLTSVAHDTQRTGTFDVSGGTGPQSRPGALTIDGSAVWP